MHLTRHEVLDRAKAVSAVKDLVGKGVKIIAGTDSSGIAAQVAPLAEQNKILYISGPAATDAITGINKYTFRSGRETIQEVKTAASFLGDTAGKKITVYAQDSAFGQANADGVRAILGTGGATVDSILVSPTTTDFTPFSAKAKSSGADLLLDEPMAGVSMEDVDGLTEVIRTVNTDQGRTVVMVEHHIDVVLGLADRVAVMHQGALLRCDTPELVMADPTVQEAYLGQAL